MSYDRRPKMAAKIDLYDKWRDVVDRHDAAERKEMQALLKEAVPYLRSNGLDLDLKRSYLSKYYSGSDGVRMEGVIYVTEREENSMPVLGAEMLERWVEAAIDLRGTARKIGEGKPSRVHNQPVGVWQVDVTAS